MGYRIMALSYPGGKWGMRFDLVIEIAERELWPSGTVEYREPFLGGGGALKALAGYIRQGGGHAWVADKDPDIANYWTALIRWPQDVADLVRPHHLQSRW